MADKLIWIEKKGVRRQCEKMHYHQWADMGYSRIEQDGTPIPEDNVSKLEYEAIYNKAVRETVLNIVNNACNSKADKKRIQKLYPSVAIDAEDNDNELVLDNPDGE